MNDRKPSNPAGVRAYNALQLMQKQAEARPSGLAQPVPTLWDHAGAGVRGAVDSLPFELGNGIPAFYRAAGDWAGGADIGAALDGHMQQERIQDRYDQKHYPAARTAGQLAGMGLQVAALGGLGGAAASGARIKEVTALIPREWAALGMAGGVAGVGQEALLNDLTGRRGSLGDYAGAAAGGGATALFVLAGQPKGAGAFGGAMTSAAQDLFNGRPVSVEKARDAAFTGGVLGIAGMRGGARHADRLPSRRKGDLGEKVSVVRTAIRGDETLKAAKSREYLPSGGYTVPDHRTFRNGAPREIVESKFGRTIKKLRGRQGEAYRELPNYRVEHFLPRDVGSLYALPSATLGSRSADEVHRRKPPRFY
jgi:hypothetical protein